MVEVSYFQKFNVAFFGDTSSIPAPFIKFSASFW